MKIQSLRFRILVSDLCLCVASMALSYCLRYEPVWQSPAKIPAPDFLPFVGFAVLYWTALSLWVHLDGFRGGWRFPAILSQLLAAVTILMVLLFSGAYLTRWYTSRLILSCFGIVFLVGLLIIRLIARASLKSRYRSGAVRKAVIVGSGPIAKEIARKIECHPEMLWEVTGFLCPAENAPGLNLPRNAHPSINVRSVGIAGLLKSRAIDELILAVPRPDHPEISDIVARCLEQGIAVSLVPQPYELYLSQPKLLDLDGLPLLKLEGVPAVQSVSFWKRSLDLGLTLCLLPLAVPAILAGAAFLKIRTGRGFRSEIRCGQFGRRFRMYRLNSDRLAVGLPFHERLMQQLSITELPQMFNVLRGEMSLVGPRPEGPEKVRHYSDWHRRRLNVRPGITGLAQVHGLRDQNSSEDKTRYDLQYILHRSPFLDVSLLLQTFWTLALRPLHRKTRKGELPVTWAEASPTLQENFSSAHSSQSGTD
jgi:lipopolysaccharide/colanic/teichoic acid biosynthesis glycosyltransferase